MVRGESGGKLKWRETGAEIRAVPHRLAACVPGCICTVGGQVLHPDVIRVLHARHIAGDVDPHLLLPKRHRVHPVGEGRGPARRHTRRRRVGDRHLLRSHTVKGDAGNVEHPSARIADGQDFTRWRAGSDHRKHPETPSFSPSTTMSGAVGVNGICGQIAAEGPTLPVMVALATKFNAVAVY
jgi:hypothetical protein